MLPAELPPDSAADLRHGPGQQILPLPPTRCSMLDSSGAKAQLEHAFSFVTKTYKVFYE